MPIRHRTGRGAHRHVFLALALLAAVQPEVRAQQLTVQQILSGELEPRSANVQFMPDGRRLMSFMPGDSVTDVWIERIGGRSERVIEGRALVPPGGSRPIDIEALVWSADERRALIYTDAQRVWRFYTKGRYYVWDRLSARTLPVSAAEGWQQFAKFSPDGAQVAFVRDNDLFVADPFAGREIRLTTDGSADIINGTGDWVYEEELDLRDAFRWSPDGRRIAWLRFDQSPIPEFHMVDEMELYPRLLPVRYPKAGTANSRVEIRVADVATGHGVRIDTGADADVYLARMEWLGSDSLVIQRLNRAQDRLDVLIASATTGRSRLLLSETDRAWVDVDDHLTWLPGGRQFLWTSERDGYNHIYLYNRSGALVRQLTRGPWDVLDLTGTDEAGNVFFTASEQGPLEQHLYRTRLDGRALRRITTEPGSHLVELAPGGRFYIDSWSRAASPPDVRLHHADGRLIRVLAANGDLAERLDSLRLSPPEFFRFRTSDGEELNGWMIRPPDFDASGRYPVLLYVYGGPGSQTVIDAWGRTRYLWHQLLAQRGIVIASVDNRGTGARGRDFRKVTHLELGRRESNDQIEAARHIAAQPFVDAARIAIWGWSYGGYMTALTMMKSNLFRAGIAVAPVTDWRLYDTIYTERFMRTPAENPQGYDRSSALLLAPGLSGRLLLIHGTGDDNVHFQNTVRLADALQNAGKPFDLMIYPNQTHSISGEHASVHLYQTMTDWIIRQLAGERPY